MMHEMKDWMFDTPLDTDFVPEGLSNRQGRILLYIYHCQQHCGFTPSIREMCDAVGIPSTSVVNYNLDRLAGHGYIGRVANISRSTILMPVSYQFIYTIYPQERENDPKVKVQHLQRENAYLKRYYETQIQKLADERDALLARLERIELVLAS